MIRLVWYKSFQRAYKKIIKQQPKLRDKLEKSLQLFVKEPFHPSLGTHKLSGKLAGYHAFALGYDCRVVFKFINRDKAALISIGSHDEVY